MSRKRFDELKAALLKSLYDEALRAESREIETEFVAQFKARAHASDREIEFVLDALSGDGLIKELTESVLEVTHLGMREAAKIE